MKSLEDTFLVISPKDKVPKDFTVINTTSRDKNNIGAELSPFNLGPIPLYENKIAKNLENAWQFTKVYKEFADTNNNPEPIYFKWAKKGWGDTFAHRYPNGKGNVPLYSYWKTFDGMNWNEHHWTYIDARRNIYFPLYAKAIVKTNAFKELQERVENGEKIALWDFDGYDHKLRGMSYEDVVNCTQYKCGHAFVLYGLITQQLKIIDDNFIFDFNHEIIHPLENDYPSVFNFKERTFISNQQFIAFCIANNLGDNELRKKIYELGNSNLMIEFKNRNIDSNIILSHHLLEWKQINKEINELYSDKLSQIIPKIMFVGFKEKIEQNSYIRMHLEKNTLNSSCIEKMKLMYK